MRNTSLALKIAVPIVGLIFGILVLFVGYVLLQSWWSTPPDILGFSDGPEQPIDFPHTVHVQKAGLDCQFCHRTVSTDEAAGIPAVQQCLFCHDFSRIDGSQSESPTAEEQIALLLSYGNPDPGQEPQPINWVRVHRLPDHVQFVHSPHIQAGLTCSTCHGDVAAMETVKQVRNLKMRDCVDCHRVNNAPTDCTTCHY
jgi:hypothetical protein